MPKTLKLAQLFLFTEKIGFMLDLSKSTTVILNLIVLCSLLFVLLVYIPLCILRINFLFIMVLTLIVKSFLFNVYFMKRVRLNQLNVGDVISYESRFWLVESVTSYCTYSGGPRYVGCFVKIHDCDDIFYTRILINTHRFYTVM